MARRPVRNTTHFHSCTAGRHLYDDTCDTPDSDAVCQSCRTGSNRPLWLSDRDPVECCLTRTRPVDKTEKVKYRLAGRATWHRCLVCSRCHPFVPRSA